MAIAARLRAEDIEAGRIWELGEHRVDAREIEDFASRWDPLPIHLDSDAAAEGHFGHVIASGLHTLSIVQRLCVLGAYSSWDVMAGRALREVRFLRPVTAGSTVGCRLVITGVDLAHPDRGLVAARATASVAGHPVLITDVETWVWRSGRR